MLTEYYFAGDSSPSISFPFSVMQIKHYENLISNYSLFDPCAEDHTSHAVDPCFVPEPAEEFKISEAVEQLSWFEPSGCQPSPGVFPSCGESPEQNPTYRPSFGQRSDSGFGSESPRFYLETYPVFDVGANPTTTYLQWSQSEY